MGSLWAVVLVHALCNWCGLPRVWGRVEVGEVVGPPVGRGKEDGAGGGVEVAGGRLGVGWTVAYYVILVGGAVGFARELWPMTVSRHGLMKN